MWYWFNARDWSSNFIINYIYIIIIASLISTFLQINIFITSMINSQCWIINYILKINYVKKTMSENYYLLIRSLLVLENYRIRRAWEILKNQDEMPSQEVPIAGIANLHREGFHRLPDRQWNRYDPWVNVYFLFTLIK